MTATDAPALYVAEAAAYLGCRRRWLLAHKAEIGYALIAGRLQFRRSDLDAYKMRQYTAPVSEQPEPKKTPTPITSRQPKREGINKVTGKPRGFYDEMAARSGR